MKDSQHELFGCNPDTKYIKESNERFSTFLYGRHETR